MEESVTTNCYSAHTMAADAEHAPGLDAEATEWDLRVGELLLRAAVLVPEEQDAFLERTVQDPAVVAEVRRRLAVAAEELPSAFLADPTGLAAHAVADGADGASAPWIPEERYVVGEWLHGDETARIHRAEDRQLQRSVALKLFASRIAPDSAELRAALAQAQVHHPNVLEIYEMGELDGSTFVAMQHVEGPTLDRVAQGASLEEIVRLVAQVADGLHAAHGQGLVHGSLEPSSISVDEGADGLWVAHLGEFEMASANHGLAANHSFAAKHSLTAKHSLAAKDSLAANHSLATDVQSLGAMLHGLFTGRVPGPESAPEPAPPRTLRPSLPVELEAVVLRAMATDPAVRYGSAGAVADDLRRYLAGDWVEAHDPSLAHRVTRYALKHRRPLGMVATSAVAVLVALVVFTALTQRAKTVADLRRGQAEELVAFMVTDLRQKLAPAHRGEILAVIDARALEYFESVPVEELTDEESVRRSQVLDQILGCGEGDPCKEENHVSTESAQTDLR